MVGVLEGTLLLFPTRPSSICDIGVGQSDPMSILLGALLFPPAV